jgi:thiol-disulfide isomerase/thioredoxin
MPRRFPVLIAAVLLGLTIAGCGADTEPASSADGPGQPAASVPAGQGPGAVDGVSEPPADPGEVPELLRFEAKTIDGEVFDGATLHGSPAMLWFWAPWCPTCRSQIPQVQDLAQAYGDRVDVVGIGSLDSAEAIADFAGDVDGVTHLEDVDGVLWQRFGITEQSSFVVLDADGEVAFEAGYGGEDDLAAEIDAVLG